MCRRPGRVRSEAAFAALAGTSPIPASSGNTIRYRLNRGGDRQLNRVLTTIVLVRMRHHPQPVTMWPDAEPKAERPRRSCASSSATSPAESSVSSPPRTQSQHLQSDRHPPSTLAAGRRASRGQALACPHLPHHGRRGSGVKGGPRRRAAIAQQPLTPEKRAEHAARRLASQPKC